MSYNLEKAWTHVSHLKNERCCWKPYETADETYFIKLSVDQAVDNRITHITQ